ncbi:MAG: hypothetical protein AAB805_01000 [Patescibacteria group bacterium]
MYDEIRELRKKFDAMDIPSLGDKEISATGEILEDLFQLYEGGTNSSLLEQNIKSVYFNLARKINLARRMNSNGYI